MDVVRILFSPNGRITGSEYWVGVLLLVAANLFLTWLPAVGGLIWLALIYVGAVVSAKRLHDAGRTGWIHLIPWAISLSLIGFGVVAAGAAALTPFMEILGQPGGWDRLESGDLDAQSTADLIAGGLMATGGLLLFWTLSALVWVVSAHCMIDTSQW